MVLGLLLIIFSNTAQADLPCRNNEKLVIDEGKVYCAKKSLFDKAGDALDDINPLNYFEKRKKCKEYADRADSVYWGKKRYKSCMEDDD